MNTLTNKPSHRESTDTLCTTRRVLKGDKTWNDLFDEAKLKHPNDEAAQAQYVADLMKSIGFETIKVPSTPHDKPIQRLSEETIRKYLHIT